MRYILDIADTTGAPANYAKEFMEEICETMGDHVILIILIILIHVMRMMRRH